MVRSRSKGAGLGGEISRCSQVVSDAVQTWLKASMDSGRPSGAAPAAAVSGCVVGIKQQAAQPRRPEGQARQGPPRRLKRAAGG